MGPSGNLLRRLLTRLGYKDVRSCLSRKRANASGSYRQMILLNISGWAWILASKLGRRMIVEAKEG